MGLVEVHGRLANAGAFFFIVCGAWGLIAYFRGKGVSESYRGTLLIGEGLMAVIGLLGFLIWLAGMRPGRLIHILYGVLTVIALPAVYAFTEGRMRRRESLIYGLVSLFMFGLILRAITTA